MAGVDGQEPLWVQQNEPSLPSKQQKPLLLEN